MERPSENAKPAVTEFWTWDHNPEPDKYGIALVPIPKHARNFLEVKRVVALKGANGEVRHGTVSEFNRIAWIARVKMQ